MKGSANYNASSIAAFLIAAVVIGCASVQEQAQPQKQAVVQPPTTAKKEEAKTEKQPAAQEQAVVKKEPATASKKKAVEVEGVISSVGQRTITFQHERKGKVREEVVGIDEKTDIQKGGSRVKLKDLQETDKALINYEPDAYTPAISVKVIGKGKVKKVGGGD